MFIGGVAYSILGKILLISQTVIGFSALIVVHEGGHFLFAKLFGIPAPTFSIGMGPAIYKRQIGETQFQIAALPVGGYVEIDLDNSPEGNSSNISYWKKLIVMLAGILFNFILAWLIFSGAFWSGMPTIKINEVTISEVQKDSAAEKAGLIDGDKIIGLKEKSFSDFKQMTPRDLSQKISGKAGDSISLLIKRDSETITKSVTLAENPETDRGLLGIMFAFSGYSQIKGEPLSILSSITTGFQMTIDQTLMIWQSMKAMFKNKSMKGAGGPLSILSQGFKQAKEGPLAIFLFFAMVSINLAVLNLLPLGILDGGRILVISIEAIIRRSLPDVFHIAMNVVSLVTFLSLTLLLTYRDLISIIWG
jgi:regulator of sigma E protease